MATGGILTALQILSIFLQIYPQNVDLRLYDSIRAEDLGFYEKSDFYSDHKCDFALNKLFHSREYSGEYYGRVLLSLFPTYVFHKHAL